MRKTASWLAEQMTQEGHAVALLSGGLTVEQRANIIGRFREGKEKVLITTNVSARGMCTAVEIWNGTCQGGLNCGLKQYMDVTFEHPIKFRVVLQWSITVYHVYCTVILLAAVGTDQNTLVHVISYPSILRFLAF